MNSDQRDVLCMSGDREISIQRILDSPVDPVVNNVFQGAQQPKSVGSGGSALGGRSGSGLSGLSGLSRVHFGSDVQDHQHDDGIYDSVYSGALSQSEINASFLGQKTIGNFGSFVYLVNQIFGPGILAIPFVVVSSGLAPALAANFVVGMASCFTATKLIDAVRMMPGNANLERRIEYTDAVEFYCGMHYAVAFRILLHVALQSLNIASICDTALALDKLLCQITSTTLALEVFPDFGVGLKSEDWVENMYNGSDPLTFGLTAGYVLVLIPCVPMGFYNIDDNIVVQMASFVFLVVLMAVFVWQCIYDDFRTEPPYPAMPAVFGREYSQVLSVMIMSYSYGMLIMPWANEAKPEVRKNWWVWCSGLVSFAGYAAIGSMLAISFPDIATDNILSRLLQREKVLLLTKVASYMFAATIILPGIPVFCITTRYDLVGGGICGPKWGMFWGNVAPWLVSWAFSPNTIFATLLNWTSLLGSSLVNFVIPLALFRAAKMEQLVVMAGQAKTQDSAEYRQGRQQMRTATSCLVVTCMVISFGIGYNVFATPPPPS